MKATALIAIAISCTFTDASANSAWVMRYSAELVVDGGSPVYLNPADKELCVPARVRLKLSATEPVRFYVFRVHAGTKPLTIVYTSQASERSARPVYDVPVYANDPPEDGMYIVASTASLDDNALKAAAQDKDLGPIRISPDSAAQTRQSSTPFWVWKGNNPLKHPITVKAQNKNGVAGAVFKFKRRAAGCENH
jgi:hypothetical protein